MSWIAVAVGGAALLGGIMQSNAAQSAANTQAGAAEYAANIGQQEFNTITAQESPFMQGGYGALFALENGLGISPLTTQEAGINAPGNYSDALNGLNGYDPTSGYTIGPGGTISQLLPSGSRHGDPGAGYNNGSFGRGPLGGGGVPVTQQHGYQPRPGSGTGTTPGPSGGAPPGYGSLIAPFTADTWKQYSPEYNFLLTQGQQGVLNGSASGSGALSGAAQKDLMSFNQNLANTSFGNAFNMYQTQQGNIYQRLAGLTQLGQAAAANTGQQGTALTGQIGQAVTNAGTAQAAGQIGSANAWSGALNNMSYMPWLYNSSSAGAGASTSDPLGP